jgi:O-antigen/teichoic acid export membrane protein
VSTVKECLVGSSANSYFWAIWCVLGRSCRGSSGQNLKKLAKVLTLRASGALLQVLFLFVVGRKAGSEATGQLFFIISVITIFSTVSRTGLDQTVTRFIAASNARRKTDVSLSIISVITKYVSIASLIASIIFLIWLVYRDYDIEYLYAAPAIFLVTNSTIRAYMLQGLEKVDISIFILNVSTPLWFILILLIWPQKTYKPNLILIYSAASFVTYIISRFLLNINTRYRVSSLKVSKVPIEEIISSAVPLYILALANTATGHASTVISGVLLNMSEIGFLVASLKVSMLIILPMLCINSVYSPKFASAYSVRRKIVLKKELLKSVLYSALSGIPIFLIVIIFPDIFYWVLGSSFIGSYSVVIIVCIGQMINSVTGPVQTFLVMTGKEKTVSTIGVTVGLLSVILGWFLIRNCGLIGAAIAQSTVIILQNCIAVCFIPGVFRTINEK